MKAPQNFAQRIKGHKITTKGKNYLLGYNDEVDNKVWIYSEHTSLIVTMLEFNWKKETYSINIAKPDDGENFFKRIPPNNFDARYFLSFDKFIKWMCWRADEMDKSIYNNIRYYANNKKLLQIMH